MPSKFCVGPRPRNSHSDNPLWGPLSGSAAVTEAARHFWDVMPAEFVSSDFRPAWSMAEDFTGFGSEGLQVLKLLSYRQVSSARFRDSTGVACTKSACETVLRGSRDY